MSTAEYEAELAKIDALVLAAIKVSTVSGGIQTLNRFVTATKLFTRLVVTSVSFMRLLPGNRFVNTIPDHTDWGSVATLTRSLVEIYLTFFYTAMDTVTDDDISFRFALFSYHRNREKYQLFREWGADASALAPFVAGLPLERQALANHPFAAHLTKEQRARALSGDHAMYLSRRELLARLPFDCSEMAPFYRFLSYQVHSTPFAFEAASNERGRGLPNLIERSYITFTIWLARKYVAAAILGMSSIFGDHYRSLNDPEISAAIELADANFRAMLEQK